MFCVRCGAKVEENQRFCPSCGTPIGAAPVAASAPPAPQGRVASHVRLLGILWLAVSALRLIPGLALIAIFRHHGFPPDVPLFVHGMMRMMGVLFILGAALGIVAGWGLLERQGWARMLAILLGALSLLDVPFGTALGIYTLWVLLPAQSEREYRRLASA